MTENYYADPEVDWGSIDPNASSGFAPSSMKNHKLQDGENVFRILPPFGTNHNKRIYAIWYLHWGFADHNGRIRPLVCTKGYENYCPICERANEFYQRKMELISEFSVKGADGKINTNWKIVPEDIKAKYQELNEKWSAIRAQRHYYFNAINLAGEVGVLKLPKTAADALFEKMQYAKNKLGINPFSLDNGCYFVIIKTKTGSNKFDVKYTVEVHETVKNVGGKIVRELEQSPVSQYLKDNFDKAAYDIHTLYPVRPATALAKIMDGDSSVFVNEANEKAQRRGKEDTAAPAERPKTPPKEMPKEEAKAATPPVPSAPPADLEAKKMATTPTTAAPLADDPVLQRLRASFTKGQS